MASKKSAKKPAKKTAKKAAKKITTTASKRVARKVTATVTKIATAKAATAKTAPAKKKTRKKRKKSKDKAAHYVDGKLFYEQIKEYYRTDILIDDLAVAIVKISTGLSFAPNFINYSYKDEMVGDAILKMFSALKNKKFNCESHNNPFSYFTTIAFHAFINRIKKEKKHRETITKYQESVYADKMQENTSNNNVYIDTINSDEESNDE